MSLYGLSVVKNEADIIEAMVRHNLAFLDHVHIIDNQSCDGTYQILEKMIQEGLNLTISTDDSIGHKQDSILTNFIKESDALKDTVCLVFLDGDEFIKSTPDRFRVILENCSEPISIPWTTYIPTPSDNKMNYNPAVRLTKRRRVELPQYYKVAIPLKHYKNVTVGPGSHFVQVNGRRVPSSPTSEIQLAHFPIRSQEQLISKVLLGDWNVRLRDRRKKEAHHWSELANRIRNDLVVTEDDLSRIANEYAARRQVKLIHDPLVHFSDVTLKYTKPDEINSLSKVVGFVEQVISQIENPDREY